MISAHCRSVVLPVFLTLSTHIHRAGAGASEWELVPQPMPSIEKIAARSNSPLPLYGLYCWADEYIAHRAFIQKTGWKHMRLSGPITDEFVRAVSQDRVEVMFTIAARRPMHKSTEEPLRQWRNRATYDSDEAFILDFQGDVARVLNRYGPAGAFWKENPDLTFHPLQAVEVYNEPNFWYLDQNKEEWTYDMKNPDEARRIQQEESRSKLYAKLLLAVSSQIRNQWPSITVVGFGTGGSGYADVRFIKAVHEAASEIGQCYDVLSTHPYTHHVMPEAVAVRSWGKYSQANSHAEIRQIMEEHGASEKPIWWTELGWGIHPDAGGRFDQANAVAGDKTVAPQSHAAYYVRGYARALRLGVDRLHFMSLVDTDSFNSGMLEEDGSPRATAHAVATMMRLLPHPKLSAVLSEGEGGAPCIARGLFLYEIQADALNPQSPKVLMAWNALASGNVTIPWAEPSARVTSMTGNESIVAAEEGKLTILLDASPIYVQKP